MEAREIARDILLHMVDNCESVDTDLFPAAAIKMAKAICDAFPEERTRACGFSELPDQRVYVDEDEED